MSTTTHINVILGLGAALTLPLTIIGLFIPFVFYIGVLMSFALGITAYVFAKRVQGQCKEFQVTTSYSGGLIGFTLFFAIFTLFICILGLILMVAGGWGYAVSRDVIAAIGLAGLVAAGACILVFGTLGVNFIFYILYLVLCVQMVRTIKRLDASKPTADIVVAYPQSFPHAYDQRMDQKVQV
jgi:hypothetical protein